MLEAEPNEVTFDGKCVEKKDKSAKVTLPNRSSGNIWK